ncbi:MAG: hypothetical protein HC897_09520 [Thermoanaerobaculia bacterium]|nr:hypothetical protein [Thermoanaerobaculia bacterium]
MPVSIAACIRRHLALPAAARQRPLTRARRSLRVTALLAVLMAPITSSALPRFQQGWLPGLGSVGASGRYSTPSLVDIDGDGDLDVMAGDYYGKFWLTRNVGSATAPRFASATGSDNPLLGIDNGYLSSLLIGDLDGDGDPDVAVGNYCPLRYFDNTGSATAPSFVERTAADSPFSGVACAEYGDFGDLDADGDLDAVLLGPSGSVYLRNTGSSLAAAFVEVTGSASPLPPVGLPITGPLTFGDLDGDGDLDGFVGSGTSLRYLRNTGTATAPGFVEQSGSDNPAAFFAVDGGAYPALGDLDGDHDLDLVIGEHDGSLRYLVNEGTPTAPRFTEPSGKGNPLFGADVGG